MCSINPSVYVKAVVPLLRELSSQGHHETSSRDVCRPKQSGRRTLDPLSEQSFAIATWVEQGKTSSAAFDLRHHILQAAGHRARTCHALRFWNFELKFQSHGCQCCKFCSNSFPQPWGCWLCCFCPVSIEQSSDYNGSLRGLCDRYAALWPEVAPSV